MTSPLNRSAQAGMGSGVEGRREQDASFGPGSCPDGPSASLSVLPDGDPSRGSPDELVLVYYRKDDAYWRAYGKGLTKNPERAHLYTRKEAELILQGFAQGMELIPAHERRVSAQGETFDTIAQWCEATFGPVTPARIATRANEEMVELLADPERVEEAADVVIVLSRYPGLWAAVERKMAINRARKWRLMGDGTGYHVPAARVSDEPPQGENASAVEGEAGQRGGKAETPSQSPDPLSQTVAPSIKGKE